MSRRPESPRLRAGLLVAAGVLLLSGLGSIDLWAPDEPRYAQVSEELRSMEHGAAGLALLHLNGEVYTQKPPLYFWLAAGFGAVRGRVTEFTARLPSALAGIGVVWLTLVLGRSLVGGRGALLGAAMLLTTFDFARHARRAQLDVLLTLFETLALLAFWRLDRGLGRARTNLLVLHAALGLGILTKGPVAVIVPLLGIAVYLFWEGRPGMLRRVLAPWGLCLSLGPGLAWLGMAAWLAPAGYLDEAVGTNVFGRFLAGTSHARPFYYYLYQFPIDFLPWTFLWPAVYWAGRRQVFATRGAAGQDATALRSWKLLLAWIGASVVFFSLSGGKRGLYLMPVFPAVALLCADGLLRFLEGRSRLPRSVAGVAAFWTLLLTALGIIACLAPVAPQVGVSETLLVTFGATTLGVVAVSALAWGFQGRSRAPLAARAGIAVCAALGVELAVFLLLFPGLDPGKSPRPIAHAAAELTAPDQPIGLLGDRALVGGLVYYAERPVTRLESHEGVQRFVEGGGRAIVTNRRRLHQVEAAAPVRVHAGFRAGSRAMVVVEPLDPGRGPGARRGGGADAAAPRAAARSGGGAGAARGVETKRRQGP